MPTNWALSNANATTWDVGNGSNQTVLITNMTFNLTAAAPGYGNVSLFWLPGGCADSLSANLPTGANNATWLSSGGSLCSTRRQAGR